MNKIDSSSWSEIKSFEERLVREPESFCFARLSDIYLKVGLVTDALHTARQGVAKHPGYLAGQRALAMACNANGLHEETLGLLEKLTAALPEDTVAQKLLAGLYDEAGDKASAIRVYRALLDFNPDDAQSKELLNSLQRGNTVEPQQLVTNIEAVVYESFDDVAEDDVYELSEDDIVCDEGDNPGKEETPTSPASTGLHDPLTTQTLAELYEQQGFTSKALDIYRTILADDPTNTRLQAKIATLESQDLISNKSIGSLETADLNYEQESLASVALEYVSEPLESQIISPLANQAADNVVGTLENWLDNIGRIKACR